MGSEQSLPLKEPHYNGNVRIVNMDPTFHDSVEVIKIRKTTSETHDDSTLANQSAGGVLRPKTCFGGWVAERLGAESVRSNLLSADTFDSSPDLELMFSTSAVANDLISPLHGPYMDKDSNLATAFRTNRDDLWMPSFDEPPPPPPPSPPPMEQPQSASQPKPKIYNHVVEDTRHPFFRDDEEPAPEPKFCGVDFEALSLWGLSSDACGMDCALSMPFFLEEKEETDDEHDLMLNIELPRIAVPQHISRELLLDQATYHERKGHLPSAQACLEKSLELSTSQDDSDMTGRAEALHKLGVVRWKSGYYAESLGYLRKALAMYEKIFDCVPSNDIWAVGNVGNVIEKSELIADVSNSIGRVNQSMGEYTQATKCFRRSVEILASVLPTVDDFGNVYHTSFARAIIGIGNSYDAMGKSSKAMGYYTNGLTVQRACLGRNHVDVAATLNSIGVIEEQGGNYAQAMECHEEALWIYKSQPGRGSLPVDVAVTLNHIGFIYFLQGDYDSAMHTYTDALKIMEDALGSGHRNVASTMYSMGLVQMEKGQFDEALKVYKKVLSIQRSALGDFHADVALTLDAIADLYEKLDRPEKAIQFCLKSLRIRQRTLGNQHLHVGLSLVRLGKIYSRMDETFQSRQYFIDARKLYVLNGLAAEDGRLQEVETFLKL
jgi:tetratricopeptide (TPR) repeat protein